MNTLNIYCLVVFLMNATTSDKYGAIAVTHKVISIYIFYAEMTAIYLEFVES